MESIKKKSILVLALFTLIISLVLSTGVLFAYFTQKQTGWQQKIETTTVTFTLNGKGINNVTNESLQLLNKGDEADLIFNVSITSNTAQTNVGEYNLDLTLDNNDAGNYTSNLANKYDGELARAIEVYKYVNSTDNYEDGTYEFICMLNEFTNINGKMAIEPSGSATPQVLRYRLVYSKTAGDYYADKSFNLHINATSRVVAQSGDKYYISTEGQFLSAINDSSLEGKTLVLNRNIEILNNHIDAYQAVDGYKIISVGYRMGLDFNGKSLSIPSNAKLSFNYSNEDYVGNLLGIRNSFSGVGGLAQSSGIISINTPQDAMFISKNLDATTLGGILIEGFSSTQLVANMQYHADDISKKLYSAGDIINVCGDYEKYFDGLNNSHNFATVNSQVLQYLPLEKKYKIQENYNALYHNTRVNQMAATITINGVTAGFVDLNLKVRGNSERAIAEYYLNKVPNIINGNIYLPAYDNLTNATLTWVSQNPNLLDENGRYLKDGYNMLVDYKSQVGKLGVIVTLDGIQYYDTKELFVNILNAEQRTALIFNYNDIVLYEINGVYDLIEANSIVGDDTLDILQKTALHDINIEITGNNGTMELPYIELIENSEIEYLADDFTGTYLLDKIRLVNQPDAGNSVNVNISITFTFDNGNGTTVSYVYPTKVRVVGLTATAQISDIASELQQLFNENDYVLGNGYRFQVDAFATSDGTYIDYFASNNCEDYVLIDNGVWTVKNDRTGRFVKINDDYYFIKERYNRSGVEGSYTYTMSSDGGFAKVGNVYHEITEQNSYNRISDIFVLPNKVPCENTDAIIQAKVWDDSSTIENIAYLRDTQNNEIVYSLDLSVQGIYHYNENEIKDYSLYNRLLYYFDGVNYNETTGTGAADGYIQVDEARVAWDNAILQSKLITKKLNGINVKNIDISNSGIKSLKGIEYFINLQGIDAKANQISDLSYIRALFSLSYINFDNNKLTDINYLAYLDNLRIINIANNNISDIMPLKYLPHVVRLEMHYNDLLSDFSPIINYESLLYLTTYQHNNPFCNNINTRYIYNILKVNKGDNDAGLTIKYINASSNFSVTQESKVAAIALRNLVVSQELYQTLYTPPQYTFEGKTYLLNWKTDDEYLNFYSNDDNTSTIGYSVVSTVVDRDIEIFVEVTKDTEENPNTYAMSLNFILTLKANTDAWIQPTNGGEYLLATTAIPDVNLRSILFEYFNTNKDNTMPISGNKYNANTITYSEISSNPVLVYNLSNKGITDLTGIQYFTAGLGATKTLLLNGNIFTDGDISPLASLTNLRSLRLDGQLFDFSQLYGMSGLEILDVYGSYNLYDEDVLRSLFQLYMANSTLVIHKDNATTAWNPFLEKLTILSKSLPTALNFIDKGQAYNFFEAGNNCFTFNVYGVSCSVYVRMNGFYGYNKNCYSWRYDENDNDNVLGIVYSDLAGYSDVVYFGFNLVVSLDGRSATLASYIELINDFNYKIYVTDFSPVNESLANIFDGKLLREEIINKLNVLFGGNSVANMESIGSGFYKDGDKYYITKATLLSLHDDNSFELTIDGVTTLGGNSLAGLEYTNIKKINIIRDANLGDGSNLINLTSIRISNSIVNLTNITNELVNLTTLICGTTTTSCVDSSVTTFNKMMVMHTGEVYTNDEIIHIYANKETNVNDYDTFRSSYPLAYLTGLQTLHILNSNVYDWEGLKGLYGIDLKELKIYSVIMSSSPAVVYASNSNRNSNIVTTIDTVSSIYEFNLARTGAIATNYSYYIGSKVEGFDDSVTYSALWDNVGEWPTFLEQDAVNEYKEFAPDIADLDVGLKINGAPAYLSTDMSVSSGNIIELPKDTSSMYGAIYDSTYVATNEVTGPSHAFSIQWKVYGIDNQNIFNSLFTTGSAWTNHTYKNRLTGGIIGKTKVNNIDTNIMLNVKTLAYDFYVIFEGNIGAGYYDSQGVYHNYATTQTKYSFLYPVLIKGTQQSDADHVSLRNFTDPSLRLISYLSAVRTSYVSNGAILKSNDIGYMTTTLDGTIKIGYNANLTASFKISNFYFGITTTLTSISTNYTKSIVNLDGIGDVFPNLEAIQILSPALINISGLKPTNGNNNSLHTINICASEITFKYENNMFVLDEWEKVSVQQSFEETNASAVYDISVVKYLPNLENFFARGNNITSIVDTSTSSMFLNCKLLKRLDLSSNLGLSYDSVEALANDTKVSIHSTNANPYTELLDLYINNTNCCKRFEVFPALILIYGNKTTVNIKINIGTLAKLNIVDIQAFVNACTDDGDISVDNLYDKYLRPGVKIVSSNDLEPANGYTVSWNTTIFQNNSFLGGGITGSINVKHASNRHIQADFELTVQSSANQSSTLELNVNGTTYTHEMFDPTLWAYLVKGKNASTVNIGGVDKIVVTSTQGALFNYQNFDLKSIKGLQNLPVSSVEVGGGDYELEYLWTGDDWAEYNAAYNFSSLTTLNISSRAFTEEALSAIRYAPNLTSLRINNTSRSFDMLKTFTIEKLGAGNTIISVQTCLAEIIAEHPSLQCVFMNFSKNIQYWANDTVDKGIASILNGVYSKDVISETNRKFFGYTQVNPECKYSLTQKSVTIGGSYGNSYYDGYGNYALNTYYKYEGASSSRFNEITTVETGFNTSIISSQRTPSVNQLINFLGEPARIIMPQYISSNDIETTGVNFPLVQSFQFNVNNYPVEWQVQVHDKINNVYVLVQNDLLINDDKFLAISQNNFPLVLSYDGNGDPVNTCDYDEVRLIASVSGLGGEYNNMVYNISILDDSYESEAYGTAKSPNYYVIEVGGVATKILSGGYYIEMPNTMSDDLRAINIGSRCFMDAFDVFESTNLINYIYKDLGPIDNNLNSNLSMPRGWVFTLNSINEITTLNYNEIGKDYHELTSLEGLQYFTNLNTISIARGSISSLEPLRNLALTSFSYRPDTSYSGEINGRPIDEYAQSILDFSPLYNGASKNTLQKFEYAWSPSFTLEDLSFLKDMPALIDTLNGSGVVTTPAIQIILGDLSDYVTRNYYLKYTATFKNLITWLKVNRVNVSLEFAGSLTELQPDYLQSVFLFDEIDFTGCDVNYKQTGEGVNMVTDTTLIEVNAGQIVDNVKTIEVNSVINDGGNLYGVEWSSITSYASIGDIVLQGVASKTYTFTYEYMLNDILQTENIILNCNANGEVVITYEQLTKLVTINNFKLLFMNDEINVITKISYSTLSDVADTNVRGSMRLNARVYIGENAFDKTFRLEDNN